MNNRQQLLERGQSKCELCQSTEDLDGYQVLPKEEGILTCITCKNHLDGVDKVSTEHWRALSDSMWSEYPAVQVVAWRILKSLDQETWTTNLLDQLYLDEELLEWAQQGLSATQDSDNKPATKDSNGNPLQDGDSVTLIKDLDVKGANFTAKRGTLVKKISLTDNPEHVEGRVDGVAIVLVAKFLKKV